MKTGLAEKVKWNKEMRTHNDNLWRHSRNVNKKKRFSNIDYSLYHIEQEIGVSKIVSKSSVLRIM